jgi:diaminopimelate decarboxylase
VTRYAAIAERVGTPLYVYDLDRVEASSRALLAQLPDEVDLFYALKANPHPEVARAVLGDSARVRAEISSTGELAAALAAGFDPARCLYTGPGKTSAELHEAIGRGVRTFSVESPGDLHRIGAVASDHGTVVDCVLRINSANAMATTSIRMTGTPSQFGIDSETLPALLPGLSAVPGTRVAGAHFFPLSNAKDEESLVAEFRHTISVAARLHEDHGLPLRLLDIGGGFSVPYGVPGVRLEYDKLRNELANELDTTFSGWRTGAPRIACESGRYLVGDSGTLVCRVVNVKESRGRRFVILDGGINTFGGMSGLGRLLPAAVELDGVTATETVTLAGPLCTPGDTLGRSVKVPSLRPGELVEIPNAGAYGPTASLLAFLGRPAPAEVVVRGDEVVSVSRLDYRRSYEAVT